ALLVAAASAAHLLNVGLSLGGVTRWDLTARLIAVGYAGLGLTVVAGLVLGLNHIYPILPGSFFARLHAHVHLALVGWVAPMVLGVAARVYPMFLLAPEPAGWCSSLQFWGLALGVPAVVIGILAAPPLTAAGAIAVAAAALAHVMWIGRMVRRRKRPHLDWGLPLGLTGPPVFLPPVRVGVGLAVVLIPGPRPAPGYAPAWPGPG